MRVRPSGIAGAVGAALDDLEDGGGLAGPSRKDLDGEPDVIGGQRAGMVAGRSLAAANRCQPYLRSPRGTITSKR